ncbi:MAG: hypothetical protein ACREOI_32105, partial [bacterium]
MKHALQTPLFAPRSFSVNTAHRKDLRTHRSDLLHLQSETKSAITLFDAATGRDNVRFDSTAASFVMAVSISSAFSLFAVHEERAENIISRYKR